MNAVPSAPDPSPLRGLLDRAGAERAAGRRRRERWLHRQAVESATLAGVLVDLAEVSAVVRITLSDGRAHAGTLLAVGEDVIVLDAPRGPRTAIAIGAVATVVATARAEPCAATGDRTPEGVRFVDVLAGLGDGDGSVVLGRSGSPPIPVEVLGVGVDVLAVRHADAPRGEVSYVALATVTDVTVDRPAGCYGSSPAPRFASG